MFNLFRRKKAQRTFTEAERTMLDLLLKGEGPTFDKLRRQCGPPLLVEIQRRPWRARHMTYLIYDACVEAEFTIGETVSISLDDLMVIDKRLPDPLRCEGAIGHGILGSIICVAPAPVRWPKHLNVDDWCYVGPHGEQSKTRLVDWNARFAEAAKPKTLPPDIEAALPPDYREYMRRPGLSWELPAASLLHLDEIYFLDHDRVPDKMVVFADTFDGSVYAFKPGEQAVYHVYGAGEVERLADSFQQWLETDQREDEDETEN